MIYVILFLEFFKVGLFSIGGGLATLPFLYELSTKYTWLTESSISDMIAISESTPGPIGVNMATYAGFQGSGILGSLCSTIGLIAPSIIIIIIISKILDKFKNSESVNSVFYGLRPAVTGLIAAAGFSVFKTSILNLSTFLKTKSILDLINIKAAIILCILLFSLLKFKKHPIVYIAAGAVIGIALKL